ncbi:hypothetical protein OF83DRAFT_1174097 [Amylostereum chailletii]|nr:hypothetical protein OF83DRAFT_1174097 [Amylostereum chailletii]
MLRGIIAASASRDVPVFIMGDLNARTAARQPYADATIRTSVDMGRPVRYELGRVDILPRCGWQIAALGHRLRAV